MQLDFDSHGPIRICGTTYSVISLDNPFCTCPVCGADHLVQYKETTCNVCKVGNVGRIVVGLKNKI